MSNTTTTCCSDHTGATISTDQANYDGLGPPYGAGIRGGYRAQTTAAGSFAPNAFGLHDVHGNVAELVQDCYGVLGYGIALPGSAGVLTPFAEVGLTEGRRPPPTAPRYPPQARSRRRPQQPCARTRH